MLSWKYIDTIKQKLGEETKINYKKLIVKVYVIQIYHSKIVIFRLLNEAQVKSIII